MAQPVIGLTLDSEPPGGYSKTHPWYALRENYCTAVAAAGGGVAALWAEAERPVRRAVTPRAAPPARPGVAMLPSQRIVVF